MSKPIYAWHFLHEGHKLRDGRAAPADGEWLEENGRIELCSSGLHASVDPFDALQHAPGPILCLVECSGQIIHGNDKLVCSRRRIVARMDATEMLRFYARMEALLAAEHWDAPEVVIDYLMTGDESIRSAAEAAARSAAWSAAWSAARSAARSAAESAAWSAACGAACGAARQRFNALVRECFEGPLAAVERVTA